MVVTKDESSNPEEKIQVEKASFNTSIAEMTRGRAEVDPVGLELTGCRLVFAQWEALRDFVANRQSLDRSEDAFVGWLLANTGKVPHSESAAGLNNSLLAAGFSDDEREPLDSLIDRLSAVVENDAAPTVTGVAGQRIRARSSETLLSLQAELIKLSEGDELGTLRAVNRATVRLTRIGGGEDITLVPQLGADIPGVGLSVGQVESALLQNTVTRHPEMVEERFGKAYTSVVELRALAMVGYLDTSQVAAFCQELGLTNTAYELSKESGGPENLQMIPRTNNFRLS